MSDLNPYASPGLVEPEVLLGPEPRLGNVVANTIRVLLAQWTTVLIALVLLCFPWELFYSYLTNHWLTVDQRWVAFIIGTIGQSTIILFAQGLIMTATSLHLRGLDTRLTSTLAHTLASFPALFLSGIVAWVGILAGCLLLIVPGIYLNIRWMYYGAAAVSEEVSGLRPLQRSWELTNNRLVFSLSVFCLYGLPMVVAGVMLTVLLSYSPTLQHWVLTAAVATVSHFTALLVCIGFTCGYHELVRVHLTPPE